MNLKMATEVQKSIIRYLSQDGSIVTMGRGKYAVRDGEKITRFRCTYDTIFRVKNYLRKVQFKKSTMWVLNKSEVLKLRKNHSFKKIYLEHRKNNSYEQPTEFKS
jgi:hypothetical protein